MLLFRGVQGLSELPKEISKLSNLTSLDISKNQLRIPQEICDIKSLELLSIADKTISSDEFRLLEQLSNLRSINLDHCYIGSYEETRDLLFGHVLSLVTRCRLLGHIEVDSSKLVPKERHGEISCGLAINRARVRISTMPQGLWPRLLCKPNSVFSLRGWTSVFVTMLESRTKIDPPGNTTTMKLSSFRRKKRCLLSSCYPNWFLFAATIIIISRKIIIVV